MASRRPWRTLAHLHSVMPMCYTGIWVTMQVHHDGDHSLACLDSYTCDINFDSFVCSRSSILLSKYSSETTRLSAGPRQGSHQGPSSAARERNRAHSQLNTKFMRFCFAHGKNTQRKSFAMAEVKVFGCQNVVIRVCYAESECDQVHKASLEERKSDKNLFWPSPDRISLFCWQTMNWKENIWVPWKIWC